MGLTIVSNSFFDTSLIYGDEDTTHARYKTLDDVVAIEYPPLLSEVFVAVVEQYQLYAKDYTKLLGLLKILHRANHLCLITDVKAIPDLKSFLISKGVHATYINGKYLPKEMFIDYANGLGMLNEKTINTIYDRMYGNLDAAQLIILKVLSTGESIDRLISPRAPKYAPLYLGVFLGLFSNAHASRSFAKIVRDEHPNYMRAILSSQMKQLLKMKELETTIKYGVFDYKEHDISRRFFNKYQDKIHIFSMYSLRSINKRIGSCKSSADILLLYHQIKEGGTTFEDEAVFIRYPNTI